MMDQILPRSEAEIVARCQELVDCHDDPIGWQRQDLLCFVATSVAKAAKLVKQETPSWQPDQPSCDVVQRRIVEYLPFALEKAINHRGISASRSIEHMKSWLWLLGDEETLNFLELDPATWLAVTIDCHS